MGGWGSGGHNRTHRQVEKQRLLRVDSFAVYDNLRYDKYTDVYKRQAQGDAKVREAVADYINRSFGRHLTGGHIYMTVGAAASLTISLKAMAVEGDEFITFSPFFPEYRVFVENAGGTLKVVPCNTEDFQIDREPVSYTHLDVYKRQGTHGDYAGCVRFVWGYEWIGIYTIYDGLKRATYPPQRSPCFV